MKVVLEECHRVALQMEVTCGCSGQARAAAQTKLSKADLEAFRDFNTGINASNISTRPTSRIKSE